MQQPPSLSRRGDFRRVLEVGTRTRSPLGTVYVAPLPDPAAPGRLGLAVSSRLGGAVERNRIKRRLRAAFRVVSLTGVDVVVRPSQAAATMPYQVLEENLRTLSAAR